MQVAEHDGAFSTYLLMLAIAETATGATLVRSRCASHCVCLSLPAAFDCASVSLSDPHRVRLPGRLSASLLRILSPSSSLHYACCYVEIKGTQGLKTCSHADSLILSLSGSLSTAFSRCRVMLLPWCNRGGTVRIDRLLCSHTPRRVKC